MSITVTPVHPEFVAEIGGVDVARPLSPPDRVPPADALVHEEIAGKAVVVFRGQALDDDKQVAFARNFGPVASSALRLRHRDIKHRIDSDEVADISNLDSEGKVLEGAAAGVTSRGVAEKQTNKVGDVHPEGVVAEAVAIRILGAAADGRCVGDVGEVS